MSDRAWFGSGPSGGDAGTLVAKVEDAGVRAALRAVRVSPAALSRALDLPPASRLTFDQLVESADFPVRPGVTGVAPDYPMQVVTRFAGSRLHAAWLEFPDPPAAMVFRGGEWGVGVCYRLRGVAQWGCVVGVADGVPYALEPLAAWVRRLQWDCPFAPDPQLGD